jgi:hypothetical protein
MLSSNRLLSYSILFVCFSPLLDDMFLEGMDYVLIIFVSTVSGTWEALRVMNDSVLGVFYNTNSKESLGNILKLL